MSTFEIPRLNDGTLISFYLAVEALHPGAELSASGFDNVRIQRDEIDNYIKRSSNNFYIKTITLSWPPNNGQHRYSLEFRRSSVLGGDRDPYLDQLKLQDSGVDRQSLPPDLGEKIFGLVSERLSPGFLENVGDRQSAKKLSKLFSAQADANSKTQRTLESFAQKIHNLVNIADDRINKQRKSDLESIQSQRKALEVEYNKRTSLLESERAELEELKKSLDDKSNTHARREIRREILQIVENRNRDFSLSESTNVKRNAIHKVFLLCLAAFASLFVINITLGESLTVSNTDTLSILFVKMIRNALPIGGFFATAAVYARWMTSWAQRHAEFEFAQRQFELDINRASWAVESSLEWRQSQGTAIPDSLLAGITRSLFEANTSKIDDLSALDALASALIGNSKLRLKIGDHEAEIDQKGMKRLGDASLEK
jgi:hypothetical protein